MTNQQSSGSQNRGFASMDPEKQRQIASKGGQAAHASGRAHEFTSEEAARAGKKGGEEVSRNRQHMAEIGRKGGSASGSARGKSQAKEHPMDESVKDNIAMPGDEQ